jgi:hypothetical protein
MMASMQALLLKIRIDPRGGFIVTDPHGHEHFVSDEVSLGRRIAALLADPDQPQIIEQSHDHVVGIVASVARRVLPKEHRTLVELTEPLAHHVTDLVKKKTRERATKNGRSRSVRGGR